LIGLVATRAVRNSLGQLVEADDFGVPVTRMRWMTFCSWRMLPASRSW
jgi:hypothetical protein